VGRPWQVAVAVGHSAIKDGVAQIEEPEDMEEYLRARMWSPSNAFAPAHSFHAEALPLPSNLK